MKENRPQSIKNVSILNSHFLDTVIKYGPKSIRNSTRKNQPRIQRGFNTKVCFLETVLKYDSKSTPKRHTLREPIFESVLHSRAGANQSRKETEIGWKTGLCKVRNTLLL